MARRRSTFRSTAFTNERCDGWDYDSRRKRTVLLAVVIAVVDPVLRVPDVSTIEVPVPDKAVWIWTTCSCWMFAELLIVDSEPL